MALSLVQSNLKFFVDDVLEVSGNVLLIGIGLLLSNALLFLPVWAAISAKIGKREAFLLSLFFWMAVQLSISFTPPGKIGALYTQAALAGSFASGCFIIPWSMLPDTIDLDELNTGRRREGAFYSFFVFFQKFAVAGGLALSNLYLETRGYVILSDCLPENLVIDPATGESLRCRQSASAKNAVRALCSYVPMFLIVVSGILTFFYPLSKQKLVEIQDKLAARKREGENHELQKIKADSVNENECEGGVTPGIDMDRGSDKDSSQRKFSSRPSLGSRKHSSSVQIPSGAFALSAPSPVSMVPESSVPQEE